MDAISLLKKHHRKAESALKKLVRSHDMAALHQIASELVAHMVIEETVFYPTVQRVKPELVLESYEEHAIAQLALKRLVATSESDPRFEARATTLLALLQKHVKEEEDQLFPKVERLLDDDKLDDLGERMQQQFEALVDLGYEAVLPKQPARVTGDRESERVARVDGYQTMG
jgi:hemerythrin superfamily protein